jgi:hypothetical protein
MPVNDALISERVSYLYTRICEFGVITDWYPDFDYAIEKKRFSTGWLKLAVEEGALLSAFDATNIMLSEEYDIVEYKLKISRYCYILRDADGNEIFRADNSEHHDVSTNPHHIHDFRFRKRGQVKAFYKQDLDNPDITEFFAHIRGERR